MMIDNVDGMISAPATPMMARHAMSWPMPVASDASVAPTRNNAKPDLQDALATETVAERAGREQKPGEDERVDRDHPLQL